MNRRVRRGNSGTQREVIDVDATGTHALVKNAKGIDLYDVATKRKRAHIDSWVRSQAQGGLSYMHDAQFLGDLVVAHAMLSPVSSTPRIFDLHGRKVADVGGKTFMTNDERPWHIAGDTYAFAAFEQPLLLVVDVRKGKVVRSFDLKPLASDPEHMPDTGHRTLAHVAAAGAKIVTLGAKPFPVVGVLDPSTGAARPLPAPRCR